MRCFKSMDYSRMRRNQNKQKSLSESMNTNGSGMGIGTFTYLSRAVWLNKTRTFRPARRIKRERTWLSILSARAESGPLHSSILARTFIKRPKKNRVASTGNPPTCAKSVCNPRLHNSRLQIRHPYSNHRRSLCFSSNMYKNDGKLSVGQSLNVTTNSGKTFSVNVRLDTPVDLQWLKDGGSLQCELRKLASK